MLNTGYAQGRTENIKLPPGGRIAGIGFASPQSFGYGGHDPYLSRANPYANGASQAGALGVGGQGPGGGFGASFGGMGMGAGGDAGIRGAAAGYASAQEANKALENELKTGFDARYKRNMDAIGGLSDQSLMDVNKIFDNKANQLQRQFGGGGSTNQSTVMASVLAQNESERAAALNRARDALTMRKVGLDADLSRDALMQRERVTNAYPDLGLAADLAQKAGAAQAPMPPEYQPQGQMPQQPGYEPQQQGYGPETHNGFGGPVQGNQPQDMRRMSYDAKRNGYKSVAEWQKAGSPGATANQGPLTAQQKKQNRMNSYAESRAQKVAARGKPVSNAMVAATSSAAAVKPALTMNAQGGYGLPYGPQPAQQNPAQALNPAAQAFHNAINPPVTQSKPQPQAQASPRPYGDDHVYLGNDPYYQNLVGGSSWYAAGGTPDGYISRAGRVKLWNMRPKGS